MNKNETIIEAIFNEIRSAEAKHPGWPIDPIHAAAILAEESGELTQAAIDFTYSEAGSRDKMKKEAIQCAAMALRFLFNIDQYRPIVPFQAMDGEFVGIDIGLKTVESNKRE